jgi:hypothetical protein
MAGHQALVDFLSRGGNVQALNFTPDEIMRVSWLRAVEWLKWPSFVVQPLLPILYFFAPYRLILVAVLLANVVWLCVRYRFVSYTLATLGCLFVRLKWPIMLVCGVYFLWRQEYVLTILTALTPIVATGISAPFVGKIGIVQQRFLAQLSVTPSVLE